MAGSTKPIDEELSPELSAAIARLEAIRERYAGISDDELEARAKEHPRGSAEWADVETERQRRVVHDHLAKLIAQGRDDDAEVIWRRLIENGPAATVTSI